MAKSNWAYDLLLDTFKQYYEKNPVSILTKAEEAIAELQEVQHKELQTLMKCIKSGQLDSTFIKSEANQGLEESKVNQTTTATTKVKLEKISLAPSQEDSEKENKNVLNEDMPAPTWVPPVKKKAIKTERVSTTRTTRTKSKKQSTVRDSDVIIQSVPVPVVNLTEENGDESIARTTRNTRTKAKKDAEAAKDVDASRTTRTKTRAATKNVIEESEESTAEVPETRSTRTKTIRKHKPVEEVPELEAEVRTTRTKTIRKAQNMEDVDGGSKIEAANVEEVIRTTRSKVVKKIKDTTVTVVPQKDEEKLKNKAVESKSKRNRSTSDDDAEEDKTTKKNKSSSPQAVANSTTQTVYEDARSSIDGVPVVCYQETGPANSTFVLPQNSKPETENSVEEEQRHPLDTNIQSDLFTDDDSTNEVKTPPLPSKGAVSKHQSNKEVFSPYQKTTTKKKVEAFEKLQSGTNDSVKTGGSKLPQLINSGVKEKTKLFTPVASKITVNSISTSKINTFFPQQSRVSSQTKSCQKDPREFARKQQEREQAQKKKEALLAYQTEHRRKLNEERKLKALQQRKALDEEKAKLLEAQKSKQEKLKQRELEREENHKKYVQEQERKRQEQKKRLLEAQKQALAKKPIYMTTKPPMLAADDYDSDDANYRKVKAPSWCTDSKLLQLCMMSAGQKIKNTMFCAKPDAVNLVEIFETIDERKLKRTSSAIWRAPPRYTMMPDDVLNKTKFSDDEDVFEY